MRGGRRAEAWVSFAVCTAFFAISVWFVVQGVLWVVEATTVWPAVLAWVITGLGLLFTLFFGGLMAAVALSGEL